MNLVTHEKTKVDRIACLWRPKRFVDEAEFLSVLKGRIQEVAGNERATSTIANLRIGSPILAAGTFKLIFDSIIYGSFHDIKKK